MLNINFYFFKRSIKIKQKVLFSLSKSIITKQKALKEIIIVKQEVLGLIFIKTTSYFFTRKYYDI